MRIQKIFLGSVLCLIVGAARYSSAEASPAPFSPSIGMRSATFRVPPALRARVNFWKDIYSKYGKQQVVIHYRPFPQVVFKVLDFSDKADELGPIALEKYKRKVVEAQIREIKADLSYLALGSTPSTPLQELIVREMEFIPGGVSKYKEAASEDSIRSQTGIREKFIEAIQRSGRYLPLIEKIFVQDYGLPIELTRLPFVESSFDYEAYSAVGAAGIWQFMPRTARLYMTVSNVVDERRDPVRSSGAAARYLAEAYGRIGNWPLTIVSYNHGVGGVLKRMRESGSSDIAKLIEHPTGRPFGFASSNFYPCFLAALEVYEERFGLFPDLEMYPPLRFTEYRLPRPMSASYASRQLGIDLHDLKGVNYALLDRVWSGRSPIPAGHLLKVPLSSADKVANLKVPEPHVPVSAPATSSIYGGVTYRVRKGDTLIKIAKKYGTSVAKLRELNNLGSAPLKIGQNLAVKEQSAERASTGAQSTGTQNQAPKVPAQQAPQKHTTITYTLKPGDTLYELARKFGTSVEQLTKDNSLKATRVRVGQKLIVRTKE